MSFYYIDGFDNYDLSTNQNRMQTIGSPAMSSDAQRFGSGYGLRMSSSHIGFSRMFGGTKSEGIIAFAFRWGNRLNTIRPITIWDGGTMQLGIDITTGNTIVLHRNGSNIQQEVAAFPATSGWHFLEFRWKVTNSTSAGDCAFRVNGVTLLSCSAGLDTQQSGNAYGTLFCIFGSGTTTSNQQLDVDDLYCMDSTTFIGERRVISFMPMGNGNYSQLTNSASNSTNNYTYVDETIPDGDTSYVQSPDTGDKDSYTFDNLPSNIDAVNAVQLSAYARKTDVNTRAIKMFTRQSGTDEDMGVSQELQSTYNHIMAIETNNPHTGVPWTPAEFNAAEFGIEVTS